MALNVANWTDKQLDELVDMLRSADSSIAAAWVAQNYLCIGSRIMTDPDDTTLRVTVNGSDAKVVDLSPGVFQHAGYVGQLDSTQTINILDSAAGTWGTGQAADPANPRWSIVCIKQTELLHTVAKRWFVNDTVVPNTYFQQNVNTFINKAYFDIVVVHGPAATIPIVPEAPGGYWTIAEIKVPAASTTILQADIYDTATSAGSQKSVPNWDIRTRVLRLEFLEEYITSINKFSIDHDPLTGYHRIGAWHIGSGVVGPTVTANALNKLTNGSSLGTGELHSHAAAGGSGLDNIFKQVYYETPWGMPAAWTDIPTLELTFTTSQLSTFILFYNGKSGTYWNGYLRFTVNNVPFTEPDVYYSGESYGNALIAFHGALLGQPGGTYTFRVQGCYSHPYGAQMSKQLFSILRIS